jgi:NAD(P)-dependent dehydrogenase (short-subunit alcohol dehydrogenase family)
VLTVAEDAMPRPLAHQVVVITGAGSGIGRETALAFAHRAATVVVAARGRDPLDSLVGEIERLGGRGLAVPTDVSDYAQVEALARRAVAEFGRIDTWVNNAAVSTYGTVEQMTPEELRRVIEVDLLGQIYGIKAALPHLEAVGDGVLVTVSSTLARRGVALQAAYCAAKHGIVGFTESLRLELRHQGSRISVVDVLPSSINTPLFAHARSKLGVLPMPIPPVYEPKVVADTIVAVAERPVRTVFAGGMGKLLEVGQRLSPALVDRYLLGPGKVVQNQQTDRPDDGVDNLDQPVDDTGTTTGDFGGRSRSRSLYTELVGLHPNRARVAAGAAVATGAAALARAVRR